MTTLREYRFGLSARWVSTLGAFFGLLGALRSDSAATAVGVGALVVSLGVILYARQQRGRKPSDVTVNSTNIGSLNAASALRRVNGTLVIQEAENTAIISDTDIVISWRCDGYCRTGPESAIEFSLDSDNNVPFENMACFAYDLRRDPKQEYRIRPVLVGPDGLSKKVAVRFLEPLTARQPFSVLLTWASPNCMQDSVDYYTTTFSFNQERVERCITRLVFLKERPHWVRVYDSDGLGRVNFLRELPPTLMNDENTEYREVANDVPARSERIYLFERHKSIKLDDGRRPT